MPIRLGKATRQREMLEKIVKDFETSPVRGNSADEMIARTEYVLAKRMLAEDECSRIQKGKANDCLKKAQQ